MQHCQNSRLKWTLDTLVRRSLSGKKWPFLPPWQVIKFLAQKTRICPHLCIFFFCNDKVMNTSSAKKPIVNVRHFITYFFLVFMLFCGKSAWNLQIFVLSLSLSYSLIFQPFLMICVRVLTFPSCEALYMHEKRRSLALIETLQYYHCCCKISKEESMGCMEKPRDKRQS